MIIEPAPHLKLSNENWEQFLNWSPFKNKVAQRQTNGFDTSKIIVNGVSFIARADKEPMILSAQARVFYTTPGQSESSYHVNFMPDAATLLYVFRLSGKEMARHEHQIDKFHVLLIKQPHWGFNNQNSLEIPGGLLDEKQEFGLASWEKAKTAALREFTQEGISPENRGIFPTINPNSIYPLGASFEPHPGNADEWTPFYTLADMAVDTFNQMQKKINGSQAGNKTEGESTRVEILSLRDAYCRTLEQPESPSTFGTISRFMLRFNLLRCA